MATPPVISEEIPKSQAKINEELFQFQAEMKTEISRAKKKLDVILALVLENRKSTSNDPPQITESDRILFTPPSSSMPRPVKAESEALFEQDECEIDQPVKAESEALFEQDEYEIVLPKVSMDLYSDSTFGDVQPIKEQQVEESDCFVLGNMIVQNGAHKVFDKMSDSILDEHDVYDQNTSANKDQLDTNEGQTNVKYIQGGLLEEVIDVYAHDVKVIKLILFDPGGDRKYAMSSSRRGVPELFDKALETSDNVLEGVDWGIFFMEGDAYKVFDEMPKLALTEAATFMSISMIEGAEFTPLKAGVWLMEKFERLYPSKNGIVTISLSKPLPMKIYHPSARLNMFNEMPNQLFDPGGSSLHYVRYATKHSLDQSKVKHDYDTISSELHECELWGVSLQWLEMRRQKSDHQLFHDMLELIVVEHTEGNGGLKSCEYLVVFYLNDLRYEANVLEVFIFTFDPGGNFGFYNVCWFDKLNIELVYEWPLLGTVTTLHSVGLTWDENEIHRSINIWIGKVSGWYEHGAIGFCGKQHSRSMMQQSGSQQSSFIGCWKIGCNFFDETSKPASVDLQENVYGKYSLPFYSHDLDFSWVVNRSNLYSGLIIKLSKFSTQGVSKKFYTSESEVRIEFRKWRSQLVVEDGCRLFNLGGVMRRNENELLILATTRADNIDEFSVSISLMINEIAGLSNHNIRLVMLVSLGHYISVLFLDGVLWVHMIDFPCMSKLDFNPQVYHPGIGADLVGILAYSVTSHPIDHGDVIGLKACIGVCVCIADWGVNKACKPQMQTLIEHLSWVEEALNKDDVGLASAIKFSQEMLINGTKIVGQDVIFFYIIEDNDVLKRNGIRIQLALALKHGEKLNGASAHMGLLECSLVEWSFCPVLLITSSKFGIRKSYILMELFLGSEGCDSINPNGLKQRKKVNNSRRLEVTHLLSDKLPQEISVKLNKEVYTIHVNAECWETLHIISLNGVNSCVDKFQLEEHLLNKNKMFWRYVNLTDLLPWSSVASLIQSIVFHASEHIEDMNRVVKFLNESEHEDILIILLTEPCKASRRLGALMLLNIYGYVLDALNLRKLKILGDAYEGYQKAKQRCIVIQTGHITVQDWLLAFYLSTGELCHAPFTPIVNTHSSCLVECSKDAVTDITPLYFDEAWLVVRNGNYGMPRSLPNCSKATYLWLELSFSDVVFTNDAQGADMSKIFIWDPGVRHFTTLRTRRLLRGRICHDPRVKSVKYELLSVPGCHI